MTSQGLLHERGWANGSSEWYTPPHLFDALGIKFDLDPASPTGGVPWIPARAHYSSADDGLSQPWFGRVWLNPPYGRQTSQWLARLAVHGDGIALVFARSDTVWFQTFASQATAICFVAGRLKFVPGDGRKETSTAGAPSILLAFGLPCALAMSESGLGQTFLVPTGGRSIRQSDDGALDLFVKTNDTRNTRSQ
jgi:DNA N-6-adenine-methyltransferase (Dam)